jgi:hypothetical protein
MGYSARVQGAKAGANGLLTNNPDLGESYMSSYVKWLSVAMLAAMVVFGPELSQVRAQGFRMGNTAVGPNGFSMTPGAAVPALINNPSNPYTGGGSLVTSPTAGNAINNPYWNPWISYMDPFGGGLRGVAAVTSANADYQLTIQNARLVREQVFGAQIENRRRLFDEIRYERMNTPTPEDLRIRALETALNRARRSPPLTEIWRGDSLNSLFDHLAKQQGAGVKGPRVDLEEDTLRKVNFTTGSGGNVALLRNEGDLKWPQPLQIKDFQEERNKLSTLFADAVKDVKAGKNPTAATLKDIKANLQTMQKGLDEKITALGPSEYIESKRYLNMLEEAYKALQDSNVSNLLGAKNITKSKNVAELIKNMTDQGLRFAPAGPGDEGAYRAMHWALLSYDDAIAQLNTGTKP